MDQQHQDPELAAEQVRLTAPPDGPLKQRAHDEISDPESRDAVFLRRADAVPGPGRCSASLAGTIYVLPNTLSVLLPFNIVRMIHTNALIVWR